ncbi:MAG: Hpt domain-containing protein [bacterium]|nr:Hpt domain-containing protein [bacterium]
MTELYMDVVLLEELRGILEEEFPSLIATYIQDSGVRVGDLRQAMTRGDAEAVRKAAHNLKGSSSNLGLVHLADLCRAIEDAACAGRLAGPEALLRIEQEQQRAVVLLRERL